MNPDRSYKRGDVLLIDFDPVALLNQIRTVDKVRVIDQWGHLSDETMHKVDEALKISLGLTPV